VTVYTSASCCRDKGHRLLGSHMIDNELGGSDPVLTEEPSWYLSTRTEEGNEKSPRYSDLSTLGI
jgi:hypothetical protein